MPPNDQAPGAGEAIATGLDVRPAFLRLVGHDEDGLLALIIMSA